MYAAFLKRLNSFVKMNNLNQDNKKKHIRLRQTKD